MAPLNPTHLARKYCKNNQQGRARRGKKTSYNTQRNPRQVYKLVVKPIHKVLFMNSTLNKKTTPSQTPKPTMNPKDMYNHDNHPTNNKSSQTEHHNQSYDSNK